MNRYLAKWNELLAPLGPENLPFTDCDQAAMVFFDLRTDLDWLERLTAIFPSGDLIYSRLRKQIVRVLGDPPVPTDHWHMVGETEQASDQELISLARQAAGKISSLTGESFADAEPEIVRDAPAEGHPEILDTWWPTDERLGDILIEIGCDARPDVSEAIDLLRECLYQLQCSYTLADHVLWPYYAPALTAPEPFHDLLSLQYARMNYLGVDNDQRLGIIMGTAMGHE